MEKMDNLFLAIERTDYLAIDWMLKRGADIEMRDAQGCTPLHRAVMKKKRECAAQLLEMGADVNSTMPGGSTALLQAVQLRDFGTVELLLRYHADADITTISRETPLHCAVRAGDAVIALMLLSAGADIEGPGPNRWTPLCEAAAQGNHEMAEILISRGADVNARTFEENTPLHLAAERGNWKIVSLLLHSGANRNAENYEGLTPFCVAGRLGKAGIVKVLRNLDPDGMGRLAGLIDAAKALWRSSAHRGNAGGKAPGCAADRDDEAGTVEEKARRLHDEVGSDVEHLARYVDMGAINSSDAEIDGKSWQGYYRRWLSLSKAHEGKERSGETGELLATIELWLATHAPSECASNVESSGLTLRKRY